LGTGPTTQRVLAPHAARVVHDRLTCKQMTRQGVSTAGGVSLARRWSEGGRDGERCQSAC